MNGAYSLMVGHANYVGSLEQIRVFAKLVSILDASRQTHCTSFVSIDESHLEALAMVRGILSGVRD
jgi:hypothetical protein